MARRQIRGTARACGSQKDDRRGNTHLRLPLLARVHHRLLRESRATETGARRSAELVTVRGAGKAARSAVLHDGAVGEGAVALLRASLRAVLLLARSAGSAIRRAAGDILGRGLSVLLVRRRAGGRVRSVLGLRGRESLLVLGHERRRHARRE